MRSALALADAIDALTRWGGRLGVALTLALVAVVGWNVLGRYAVGATPVWMQELEWHLMAPVALLGVAALMRERGHVRVDMLYERMAPRTQRLLDCASMLVGAVVMALFVKYSAGFVGNAWSIGEGSPDPGGLPARWALKALLPVGFALIGLQCLSNAIRDAAALRA